MDLLARREHSRLELYNKLLQRDFEPELVDPVLDLLIDENLLSDSRFTENFIRYRLTKGQGPVRIRQELRQRGIEQVELTTDEQQWLQLAAEVRSKRFGDDMPNTLKDKAKQSRFLQYRGFTADQIRNVLKED